MGVDDITSLIIECAVQTHQDLGPGLLESVYETIMERLLSEKGLSVERQKSVSFTYKGMDFIDGFRCDLVANGKVVVEIKSTEKNSPVHAKQLLTYLKLMDLSVGLVLNFGMSTMKDGIHRVVNHYIPSASGPLRVDIKNSDC